MGQALYLEGGVPKASSVSKAELEYLSGVTSGVQAQLSGKMPDVTPGASGNVLTSNGTAWVSSAPVGGGGTGTGAWSIVTGSRALGTSYTNTGSTTRWIDVWCEGTVGARGYVFGYSNGLQVNCTTIYPLGSDQARAPVSFPVPPGTSYHVNSGMLTGTVIIAHWREYQ